MNKTVKSMEEINQDLRYVENIIDSYGGTPDSLISILQDIQSKYHYLPEYAIRYVASHLELPLIQVYGVVTFFKAFSLKPRGKHIINICLGTACHVRGGHSVLEEFERQLGIKNSDTTEDMQFTLESVNCVGACALGPVVAIDGEYSGNMSTGKVKKLLKSYGDQSQESTIYEKAEVSN